MLGRKQSVRNNEDWKNALDHIEETVPKKELDSLVKKTVKDIKEKCKGKKAAYAWSAGKDSLVLGEICEKAGIDQSVLVRCIPPLHPRCKCAVKYVRVKNENIQ